MRVALLVFLLLALAGGPAPAVLAQSTAEQQERFNALRQKWRDCRRNRPCRDACMAAQHALQKGASDAEEVIARCEAEHAKHVAAPPSAPSSTSDLRKGYAWMPDVTGTIARPTQVRRGYHLVVPDRQDWEKFCQNHAQLSSLAFKGGGAERKLDALGTRVRFGKLQYEVDAVKKNRRRSCVVGEYEILN